MDKDEMIAFREIVKQHLQSAAAEMYRREGELRVLNHLIDGMEEFPTEVVPVEPS